MYGKFSAGYQVINERATLELQYWSTPLAGMYRHVQLMYASTMPGMTQTITPLAKSTPVTQPSQIPTVPGILPTAEDILEPRSNEQARSN